VKADRLIQALSLPDTCLVNQKVPKTVLTAQAATGAADKRLIKQGIETVSWIAALKPDSIGVPACKDARREYLEVSILHVALRPKAKTSRLIKLIHRAVPYPVLLIASIEDSVSISVAHKRWAQNEKDIMVIEDGFPQTTEITDKAPEEFFEHLSLSSLPKQNMFALYSGWINTLTALEAFYISGRFRIDSQELETPERKKAIIQIRSIESEITRLKRQAAKESQMQRLVDINMKIKGLEASLKGLVEKI